MLCRGVRLREVSRLEASQPDLVRADEVAVEEPVSSARKSRISLPVKLLYSAFVAVMVPYYLREYGPTNFLYFCDVAVLMTLVAVWTESALLASMPAIGILLPQVVWCSDFLAGFFGKHLTGTTVYMFDSRLSLFARGLSFFHCWLPFFLLWAVWRLGYDRRALAAWTGLAWALFLVCYLLMPAPPTRADNPGLPVNINYVYGIRDDQPPQQWMPPLAWLAMLMVSFPLVIYLPTHVLLAKTFRPPRGAA